MATLDAQEIAVLVAKSGWFPNDKNATVNIDTAVAIALAESGGNTEAVSSTNDYGLFQINKSAHASLFSGRDWKNPTDNVAMAAQVYKNAGNSFTPWVTYQNGAYKKYLKNPAVIPKSDAPNSARNDAISAVKKTANVAGGVLSDVFNFINKGLLVIGASILSVVLIGLGAWFLLSKTDVGRKINEEAKSAALLAATKGAAK